MTYKLFIDDERNPVTDDWVIVRTSTEASQYVWYNGPPDEISFDHDLGGDDTSILFLKKWLSWIINEPELNHVKETFTYSVHSQNPIGAKNIHGYMKDILEISNGY